MTAPKISLASVWPPYKDDGWQPNPTPIKRKRDYDRLGIDRVGRVSHIELKRGFFQAIRRAFGWLFELYEKYVPVKLKEKLGDIKKFAGKGIELVRRVAKFVKPFFDEIRLITEAIDWRVSKFLQALRKARIVGVLAIIGTAISVTNNIKALVTAVSRKDASNGVEAGFKISQDLSGLTVVGQTTLLGLVELGAVSAGPALSLASSSLLGVGAVFSLGTVGLNIKQLVDSTKFSKGLQEAVDGKTVDEYIQGQTDVEIQKRFGVRDGGKLKKQIQVIWKKHKDINSNETKEVKENVEKAMKKRLFAKKLCHALTITAAVVSILAFAILIFTPFAPIGFGLLALSTALTIAVLVTDVTLSHQFNKLIVSSLPKEEKYLAPLKNYEWEHGGKKAFYNDIARIRTWKF